MSNGLAVIRAVTRSLAFIIPLISLCAGRFLLADVRDTITGAIIGAVLTASVFYFKKAEEP